VRSDLASRLSRARALARRAREHFPNHAAHARGPAGVRLAQAHGASRDCLGGALLGFLGGAGTADGADADEDGAGTGAGTGAGAGGERERERGGTGSLADGSVAFVSYAAYHGSGVGVGRNVAGGIAGAGAGVGDGEGEGGRERDREGEGEGEGEGGSARGVGSHAGFITGTVRRPRVPFSHLDALVR
jgi:hypothetical protein